MPKWRFFPPGDGRLEVPGAFVGQQSLVRRPEIRRAAHEPGHVWRQDVEDLARGLASGDTFRVRREDREVLVPSHGKLALLHLVDLGRELGILGTVVGRTLLPLFAGCGAAGANPGREVLAHAVGHEELRLFGPAVVAFDDANLVVAERLTVRLGGVLPLRRAVADVAVQNDEGGAVLRALEHPDGALDPVDVVGVADPLHIPAVPRKRVATSSVNVMLVFPSMVMWLLSKIQQRLSRPRCPASDAASEATPSMRQPSPHTA